MAISRTKKEQLVGLYGEILDTAINAVVISQVGLPVNEVNKLRKSLKKTGGQLMIVKKRLLLKSLEGAKSVEAVTHSQLPGSLMLLLCKDESSPLSPLKVIADYTKLIKKEGLPYQVQYGKKEVMYQKSQIFQVKKNWLVSSYTFWNIQYLHLQELLAKLLKTKHNKNRINCKHIIYYFIIHIPNV